MTNKYHNNKTDKATIKCAHLECELIASREEACWNCGEYRCPDHNQYVIDIERILFEDVLCFIDKNGVICPVCSKFELPTIDGRIQEEEIDWDSEIQSLKDTMISTARRKKYFFLLKNRIDSICTKIDKLESPLEDIIFAELFNKELDKYYEPQVNIFGHNKKFICRADFASLVLKVAIFTDGRTYHSTPEQIANDREQERQLENIGWIFIRFWTEQVLENSNEISKKIYHLTYKRLEEFEKS